MDESDGSAVVPVLPANPVWGSREALVTIVEYADFQCRYCSMAESALARVRETYGPGVVRVVWKNLPLRFHPNARPAAEAAMGVFALAGADGFWKFSRAAFGDQGSLDAAHFFKWATDAGVRDMGAYQAGLASHRWAAAVDADAREAGELGITGTPTFLVNGIPLLGAEPFDEFRAVIDRQISAATAKIQAGTPRDRVYSLLARENLAEGAQASAHSAPGGAGEGDAPDVQARPIPTSLPDGDPARGNLAAKVTVHEWSDFQCPFCSKVEPTLARVMKEYGTRIKFVWHDLPLSMHSDASLAARAAREAFEQGGTKGFWSMHDRIFGHQQALGRQGLDDDARALGLNMVKWKASLDGTSHQQELDADARAAQDANFDGTPSFLIVPSGAASGYTIVGAQDFDQFRKVIERALAEAR